MGVKIMHAGAPDAQDNATIIASLHQRIQRLTEALEEIELCTKHYGEHHGPAIATEALNTEGRH